MQHVYLYPYLNIIRSYIYIYTHITCRVFTKPVLHVWKGLWRPASGGGEFTGLILNFEVILTDKHGDFTNFGGLFIFGYFVRCTFCFFWVPGSMFSCFSDFLLFCFYAFLLLCFSCISAFLLLCFLFSLLLRFSCFSVFLFFFCFSGFFAFLLLCFPCFTVFVLLCLSTSTILLFLFFSHVFLLLYFLLLCFFASCLYCPFVFHFLLLYSVLFVS